LFKNIAGRKLTTVYVNQTILNGKLRKKLGGQPAGQAKIWGCHGPPRSPLRIATGYAPAAAISLMCAGELAKSCLRCKYSAVKHISIDKAWNKQHRLG